MRILEMGSFIAAPYAGWLLAETGAEVVKVEPPQGETARAFGPFPGDVPDPERSGLYLSLNRGKVSVSLDCSSPTGRGILLDLLRRVDAFVCDLMPAQMRDLGLDYRSLSAVNPHLVVTAVTTFGASGPYGRFLGSDLLGWNASGAGDRYLGIPDEEPPRAAWYLTDHWAGVQAAGATMTAYHARLRTGKGQFVDCSSAEAVSSMIMGHMPLSIYHDTGDTGKRGGYTLTFVAPCGLFPCADGHVYLACLTGKQWTGLGTAMGNPEWADNPLFNTPSANERNQFADEIYGFLRPWLLDHGKGELFELCQRNAAPVTPVYTAADLDSDRHLAHRGLFVDVPQASGESLKLPASPFSMGRGAPALDRAPLLGEHNEKVLGGWLGIGASDLADLRRAGVV